MPIRIFELAAELNLAPTVLQQWLEQHDDPRHSDAFAMLDDRAADAVRAGLAILAAEQRPRLTGFAVGNFKAFSKTQRVDLRPITLVFGPNSSGKSSLLHALLWANHVHTTGDTDVRRPRLAGESVQFGEFAALAHKGWIYAEQDPFFQFVLGTPTSSDSLPEGALVASLLISGPAIDAENGAPRDQPQKPYVSLIALEAGGDDLLSAGARRDGKLTLDSVNFDHPFLSAKLREIALAATFRGSLDEPELAKVRSAADQVVARLQLGLDTLLPHKVEIVPEHAPAGPTPTGQAIPDQATPQDEAWRATVETGLVSLLTRLLRTVHQCVGRFLDDLFYLGPLRSYPDRAFALTDRRDENWHAGGGWAWDLLRDRSAIRAQVNAWLGDRDKMQTPYRFELRTYADLGNAAPWIEHAVQQDYEKAVAGEVDLSGFQSPGSETKSRVDLLEWDSGATATRAVDDLHRADNVRRMADLYLVDGRTNTPVNHRDVGVGVSQILPVLVHAFAEHEKTILIEQPEIHVHPSLQAEIGDVFIESALGERKNRFILETHSEHLILRILRRIRQCAENGPEYPASLPKIRPEDVSVIYVEPTKDGSVLRNLRVSSDGKFDDDWPGGFFTERFREVL